MLAALQCVALREDPPAVALRGIAMAQLGDYTRARELLRRAGRGFGRHEQVARARCVVAEAEVALALRDLGGPPRPLAAAATLLQARGDSLNAQQARLIALRRLLLLGRLGEASAALAELDSPRLPPLPRAVAELAAAEIALRSLRTTAAAVALQRAAAAAAQTGVPALIAEVAQTHRLLDRPAARRLRTGAPEQVLRLAEVEALLASDALVIDGCRRGVRAGGAWYPLARRPLLFVLLRALAEAWPQELDRKALIARAFRSRDPDQSHRARLRVEIGRLRRLLAPLLAIDAGRHGFTLRPRAPCEVVVLLPPIDGDDAALLALLADGAAWSTSALALALGDSQRSVQRALAALEAAGRVRSIGRARAQRWLAPPLCGFTTILLLPAALPPA